MGLGSIEDNQAVDVLLDILQDSNEDSQTRAFLASSLGRICDRAAAVPLARVLSDQDEIVQKAAASALDGLEETEVQEELNLAFATKEIDPVSLIRAEVVNEVGRSPPAEDCDELYSDHDNSFRCRMRRKFSETLAQSLPRDRFVCGVSVQNGYHILNKPTKLSSGKVVIEESTDEDAKKVGAKMIANRLVALCHNPESEQAKQDDLEEFFGLHIERSRYWPLFVLVIIEKGHLKISCTFRRTGGWVLKNVQFAVW